MQRNLFGLVSGLSVLCIAISSALAQSSSTLQTTQETVLRAGPGSNSAGVITLASGQQLIILQPKSVIIGKGVTIGQGVFIEGKPWHQVQLPNGQTGYLSGSLICSPSTNIAGTAGICSGR